MATERNERGMPPKGSMEGGMFTEMFKFKPTEQCDLDDIIQLLTVMDISFPREVLSKLPKKTQRQFIRLGRDGVEHRVGSRPQ